MHFNRMSDSEENGNNVRKGNEGAADSGVISDRADDGSWLHKTLESFSFSFDKQQLMHQEVFMRTLHEMKETTNQEIARQQAQFQQFLENSKEQIIEAVRTPLFASTPMPPSSSGMMRTSQNPTSSEYDCPSAPRSHATSGWTPSSQQSSSANQPSNGGNASNQGAIDRRFEEALRVIEAREEQHPSPYGPSSRSNSRSPEQGSLQRGPQTKLPNYYGQDDIDVFLVPFERIAERYAWSEIEKIDRLYESLKGKAMWYVCSLPRAMTANYRSMRESLTKRFGRKNPPSTVRRKLADMRQRGESNDEFGEEVRRLVTQAYPGTDFEMQDQLAAEAFLRGYRNSRIAFDVLNKAPRTLIAAIEMVTCQEHNYRASVGRDYDQLKKESARRVTWIDESDDNSSIEEDQEVLNAQSMQRPTYVTIEQLDNRLKQVKYRLKRVESRKRQSVSICSRTWKVDASSADKLDILKMNVEPGFKQVDHKKKT